MFSNFVKKGKFFCFQTKESQEDPDASLTNREPDFTN